MAFLPTSLALCNLNKLVSMDGYRASYPQVDVNQGSFIEAMELRQFTSAEDLAQEGFLELQFQSKH